MSTLRELRMYGRFMFGLPAFLRRRITVEQAEAALRLGLAERETNFLRLARRGIYGNPRSPYRKLLEMAGCTYGDLESSVRTKGLEPTLRALRAEGVYVTFEEYKGRQPLVRGGQTFEIDPHDFDNPLATRAYAGTTGGSTGAGTRVETDLDNIYALTQHVMIGRDVHGVLTLPGAVWKGTLPEGVSDERHLKVFDFGDNPADANVAKLAANYKLREGKAVGLITIDTYRIAAVDQLRTYAQIIDVPLQVVITPNELRGAVQSMGDRDYVLIDTAGRSQRDQEKIGELATFFDIIRPDEVHLVLASTCGLGALTQTIESFQKLGIDRVILTKLDELYRPGRIVDLAKALSRPIAWVTWGRGVLGTSSAPDDPRVVSRILGTTLSVETSA